MVTRRKFIGQGIVSIGAMTGGHLFASQNESSRRTVKELDLQLKIEEDLYSYTPANNGAGPMWGHGMTSVVRSGDQVFASGLETVPEVKGLSNCKWLLFKRYSSGWKLEAKDLINLTREPCSLAVFNDGKVLLSANPKQADSCTEYCLTHPEILRFNGQNLQLPYERLVPVWENNPGLNDHSYRAIGVDSYSKELILFQNYMYHHAEWSFMNKDGVWGVIGSLKWPTDIYNGKEVPLRLCYSNVLLRDNKVFFFSTADVVEPNEEWKSYKKKLTGATWDYVFRRLYFSWTDDITKEKFHSWIEIANRDKTAGNVRNQDMWLDAKGRVHLLWIENAIDERLRDEFFPDEKQERSLNYAILNEGKLEIQRSLITYREGDKDAVFVSGNARFQARPDGRLFVVYYQNGQRASEEKVSENCLIEVFPDGTHSSPIVIPFKKPFVSFQTANERAGCTPSDWLDMLGVQDGKVNTISYGQVYIGQ